MYCCTEACVDREGAGSDSNLLVEPGDSTAYEREPKPEEEKPEPDPPLESDVTNKQAGEGADLGNNLYTITFPKPAHSMTGVTFDGVDDLLVISEFAEESFMAEWNSSRSANDPLVIRQMDRVISVNGRSGTSEDMEVCFYEEETVKLVLQRPRYLTMQVKNKAGKSLGLEVEPCKNSLGLVILDVKDDGIIAKYNQQAPPEKRVEAYCSIYALNGYELTGPSLLKNLQQRDKVESMYLRSWKKSV